MKILLVLHGTPIEKMGGAGLLVHHLSQELAILGHEVHVLAPQNSSFQTRLLHLKKDWGALHILETQYFQWSDSWENKQAQILLQTWLQELKPDVCHIHHLSGLPLNFHQLLPQRTKLIITLHDYAIPCARGQLYHREHRICHSNDIQNCLSCLQPFRASKGAILRRLEIAKELLFSAHVLLSPSQDLAHRFQNLYSNCNIQTISLPLFEHLKTSSSYEKNTDFIFVGSIIPTKGLDLFLKALLRFPQDQTPSAKIIGFSSSYPTWKNYEQYCRNLASLSPAITWLGEKEHAETIQEMKSAQSLVLPSLWAENSPITIREATSLGLQVICSAWGGSSELLSSSQFILDKPSIFRLYNLLKEAQKQQSTSFQTWPSTRAYCQQLLSVYN